MDSRERQGALTQTTARATDCYLQLGRYEKGQHSPGASIPRRIAWYVVNECLFRTGWFISSSLKCLLLRVFGGSVGIGVVIKPHVNIKFPWKLSIGDNSWIGEEAWIDNLDRVTIGHDCCVSQGVYLCTGSHDPRQPTFPLIICPIAIGDGVWIGARSLILGGVVVEDNAVVAAGTTVCKDVPANQLVVGTAGRLIGDVRPLSS